MKNLFKLISIFVLLISLFLVTSFAESINLYNQISDEESAVDVSTYSAPEKFASVSSISSVAQANLKLNNILCIILVAIGILLILLAIAILIKLQT